MGLDAYFTGHEFYQDRIEKEGVQIKGQLIDLGHLWNCHELNEYLTENFFTEWSSLGVDLSCEDLQDTLLALKAGQIVSEQGEERQEIEGMIQKAHDWLQAESDSFKSVHYSCSF